MPKMLRRAAVVGGVAQHARKAGAAQAQEQAAAQQAALKPEATPQAEPVRTDPYEALKQSKELLDQGILTQAEFDAQKQKI